MLEAIALNRARAPRYAEVSQGRSRKVSRRLVFLEWLTAVAYARWMDWRGARWNRQGIGIVRDDFAPMDAVKAWDAPTRYQGVAEKGQVRDLRGELKTYRRTLRGLLRARDLPGAAAETARAMDAVEAREAEWGCHFAMCLHVLEQVGYALVQGVGYAEQSDGGTLRLTASFVWGCEVSLDSSLRLLDLPAQRAHALGAGVVVNDVPLIPFRAAWEAYLSARA